MNFLTVAKCSGGDSGHFLSKLFFLKKSCFLDPLDPFLDTSDDVETHREASQTILEKKHFCHFSTFWTCQLLTLSSSSTRRVFSSVKN